MPQKAPTKISAVLKTWKTDIKLVTKTKCPAKKKKKKEKKKKTERFETCKQTNKQQQQ